MKEGLGNDNLAVAWQFPGQLREIISAHHSLIVNSKYKAFYCGIDSCNQAVWDTFAGGVSCGERIIKLQTQDNTQVHQHATKLPWIFRMFVLVLQLLNQHPQQ